MAKASMLLIQLVTNDNLALMSDKKIPFISRLPETFKISAELKEWAWTENHGSTWAVS